MRRLVAPRSIAIVGASPRAGSFGATVRENCRTFDGMVYLVNPAYEEIDDQRCYSDLADLAEVPDCVIISVKRELVEPAIAQCAALGVGGAIVFASGFAEVADPARKAEQTRLAEMARQGGVLLAGPNTVGSSNFVNGAVLTFSPEMAIQRPAPGAIAVVSQSGAVGYALAQAMRHDANLSHILVCGNSADVDVADYVGYLAEDPACSVVICLVEGMNDPRRLVRAAEMVRDAGKTLILFKAARGEVAAAAALSHTGSIAGSHRSYTAALRAAGAIFVDDQEALIDTAAFFAKAGRPTVDGVGIITASGGWGIILADQAEAAGVLLPPLPDRARTALEAIIPEFGSAANPCDVTAQILSNRKSLAQAAGALLDEPCYGLLVWPQVWTTQGNLDGYTTMIADIGEVARARGKIACMVWGTQWLEGPGVASAERNDAVAVFRSARHCFAAIAEWQRREALRRTGAIPEAPARLASKTARAEVSALLEQSPEHVVTERHAKAMLAAYGVRVVTERAATSPSDAARVATEIGFPVVVKVESADLPHKSEAGGVRLNLRSAAEVETQAAAALDAVARHAPEARIDGLLVQSMLTQGVEILVGTKLDPHFGPIVVAGFGGILAEIVNDVAVRPAPVSPWEASAMLDELRCRALLDGARNLPKVDLDSLTETIARISELAAAHPDSIAEIDVNPLICAGDRIIAADALIIRA